MLKASHAQVLEGDRLTSTPYVIKFGKDVENEILCSKTLSAADLKRFAQAVGEDYYFQVATACMHAC